MSHPRGARDAKAIVPEGFLGEEPPDDSVAWSGATANANPAIRSIIRILSSLGSSLFIYGYNIRATLRRSDGGLPVNAFYEQKHIFLWVQFR
jgi:hypothetical protein